MSTDLYSEKYWRAEIDRALKHQEERGYIEKAEKSIELYEAEHCLENADRQLNAWWMVTNTLLPAYYSRVPKTEVTLRKKRGGPAMPLAARLMEGATQYPIDNHFPFDAVATRAVMQYLLTGRTSLWVRYEASTAEREFNYLVRRNAEGALVYADTEEPFDGEETELEAGEDGTYTGKMTAAAKDEERVVLDCPHYSDFLVCAGRDESEVTWKAKRAFLTRLQAEKQFGDDFAKRLKYDTWPEELTRTKDNTKYEGKAELWEIWCKESGKVYWLFKRGDMDSLMLEEEPPLKFEDFYPCVDLVQNITPDSVVGVSDYTELEDQLMLVERLTTRMHWYTEALRTNIAAEDTIAEKLQDIMRGDLKVTPVPTTSKKLADSIEFTPSAQYADVLVQLTEQREMALAKIYEATGAADIVRSVSDPRATATAEELKAGFWNARFSLRQRQIHEMFGRAISKMGAVIADHFAPEKIAEMANMEEELAQTDPMLVQQAFALIKSPDDRCYKIDIATDSMVAMDEKQDREQRTNLLASAGGFLQQLEPLLEKYPAIAPMGLSMLTFAIRSYRGGKELEQTINGMASGMIQQIQQRASQPAPDPGAAQAQAKMQEVQINAQIKQQQMQLDAQKAQIDVELRRDEMLLKQSEIQLNVEKLRLEQMKIEAELQLKSKEIDSKEGQAILKAQMEQRMADIDAQIKAVEISNDKQRVSMEMYEKLLEEKRLSLETQLSAHEKILEEKRLQIEAKAAGQKARTIKISRDKAGHASELTES